jgi:nascent polypeptide-associated complex subunit beta
METNPAILAAREKLKSKFNDVRTGGKGTTRRKKRVVHVNSANDDKKLQGYLKRIGARPIEGIEEVLMFQEDLSVISFTKPRQFLGAMSANTFVVSGSAEVKGLDHLMKSSHQNFLGLFGAENIQKLQKLMPTSASTEEDYVPDLVGGDFEEVSKQ